MAPALFVALDFGTANSGFAFATLNMTKRPLLHYEYPDIPHGYPKTRTALLYHTVPGQHVYAEDFKLALDPPGGTYQYTLPDGLSAEQLVSDFLRELSSYAVSVITRRYPTFRRDLTRWALTVPAKWGEASKAAMRRAAQLAGIVDDAQSPLLLIIVEPEAGAVCVRSQDGAAMPLSAQDTFMVIDAGGGTTDITLHTVAQRGTQSVLSEAAHRGGILVGGKLLDREFERHVRDRVGAQVYDGWAGQLHNARERRRFLHSDWEQVKRRFDGGAAGADSELGARVLVTLPNSLRRQLPPDVLEWVRQQTDDEDGYFPLDGALLQRAFDDAVAPVVDLARQVVQRWRDTLPADLAEKSPTYVVLVGGLGSNPYFIDRLREAGLGDTLVAPAYGYSAILEGAVLCAQRTTSIAARRSVATYGVSCSVESTAASRPLGQFMHAFHQVLYSSGSFWPFVVKNELVPVDKVVETAFAMGAFRTPQVKFLIFATSAADAVYTDEPGMVQVGEVTLHVPNTAVIVAPTDYMFLVAFLFGAAEIQVRATDLQTGDAVRTTVAFAQE